jgi:hypothetical protein
MMMMSALFTSGPVANVVEGEGITVYRLPN